MYLYLNPLEIGIKKKNFLWFFSKQSLVTGVAWFCLGIWRVTKLRWLTIKSLKCFWIVSYGPLCLCPNPVTFLLPCFPLILQLIQYCTKKTPTVLCHKTEALPAEAANFSIMIYVFRNDINFSWGVSYSKACKVALLAFCFGINTRNISSWKRSQKRDAVLSEYQW